MEQKYSSKDTSVNKFKLPAVYNKLNWKALKSRETHRSKVLDYGAGKYTKHIRKFVERHGFDYFPYDPYNCSDEENFKANWVYPDVIICSNVLNVIAEDAIVEHIHSLIRDYNVPYFITVWDGDKSKIPGPTRSGYQRNMPITAYLKDNEVVRKGVITMNVYKGYIK